MWHLHHASCAQHLLDEQHRQSTDTVLSNNETSTSCNNNNKDKNYYFHFDKNWKYDVLLWCPLQVWPSTSKSSQKSKKKETFPSFLDDNLYFTDTVWMGLDSISADLKRPDDVTNPFDFDNWQSTASRTSESTTSTNILKLYNTNQDYTMTNNCLVWKRQYNVYSRFHWERTQQY